MGSRKPGIAIRHELQADWREAEELTRDAFWDIYKPGCDEHLILHRMRSVPAFVPELDFVAVLGGRIVGAIVYTRASVVDEGGASREVLCMGPIAVLPGLQGRGIGSALMERSLAEARKLGFPGVVIYGNPAYYRRFGYRPASDFGISTPGGENFEAFMALELEPGSLSGSRGRFHEDPVFSVDPGELEEFERSFPPREKHVRPGQL